MEPRPLYSMPEYDNIRRNLRQTEMWLQPETLEKIRALNARRDALEARRQKLKASVSEFQSFPVESISLDPVNSLARERTEVLKEEISFRRDFIELDREVRAAANEMAGVQYDFVEQTKAEVELKLLKMGYHPVSKEKDPCKIQPGWIFAHPAVRDDMDFLENLKGLGRNTDRGNLEAGYLEQAERELVGMRDKALVGLR